MGGGGKHDTWARATAAVAGLCLGVGLVGCGQKSATETKPEPVVSTAQQDGSSGNSSAGANDGSAQAQPKVVFEPRLHQPFADATLAEPPEGWERPPDMTLSGQSVGKLYTDAMRLWDTIKFTSS